MLEYNNTLRLALAEEQRLRILAETRCDDERELGALVKRMPPGSNFGPGDDGCWYYERYDQEGRCLCGNDGDDPIKVLKEALGRNKAE